MCLKKLPTWLLLSTVCITLAGCASIFGEKQSVATDQIIRVAPQEEADDDATSGPDEAQGDEASFVVVEQTGAVASHFAVGSRGNLEMCLPRFRVQFNSQVRKTAFDVD